MKARSLKHVNGLFMALVSMMLSLLALGFAPPAPVASGFITAPNRIDMVHDAKRNVLYITSGSEVLRYDLKQQKFLPSFALGGSLMGIDLSLDGNTLAVADSSYSADQAWIYLVNLKTNVAQKVGFPRGTYDGGTFSVAFGKDGNLLITSRFLGSGWEPLRRYSPATGQMTTLWTVTQDTMLSSSADRTIIGFAESNISDGRWGRYRVSDGNLVERTGYTDGTSWFNYEIGVNRNGTQFALPTYGGTFIYNSNFLKMTTLGQYAGPQPIGVVYHPTQDLVYFAWAGTPQVLAFETVNFTQVAGYSFQYTFQNTGNHAYTQGRLKISGDGSLLFATVDGGIRYVRTSAR